MRSPGIYAAAPELSELVDPQSPIEKVLNGFGSIGGIVFSRIGFLLFSDLQQETIYRWDKPATKLDPAHSAPVVFRERAGRTRGLTFDHQGRLLICESGAARVTRMEKDGSITALADRYDGKAFHAPSDLVYNIDGSIYFCDSPTAESLPSGNRTGLSAIFRIARTQIPGAIRLELASRECDRPVGVTLSPKQDLLFVTDAGHRNIRVHSINVDGTLAPGRVFAEFKSDEPGEPAELKTDERGNVYAIGPGGLWIFTPSGKHLGTIVLPELSKNCCWGGGFNGLYITAGTSVYYIPTKVSGTKTY